jgi:hypothetical protein
MSQDIAFRRIRGRIVPIKLNKQRKEQIKGGAIAATGAAIAVGGGSFYKRAVSKSASLAQKAFDALTPTPKQFSGIKNKFRSSAQMSFDDFIASGPKVDPQKAFRAANRLSKLSGVVRKLSPGIGGALFAYGGAKLLNNSRDKKFDPDISALIGAGASQSLPYAIKKGEALFQFGLQPRQMKMKIAGEGATALVKKFASKAFGMAF